MKGRAITIREALAVKEEYRQMSTKKVADRLGMTFGKVKYIIAKMGYYKRGHEAGALH